MQVKRCAEGYVVVLQEAMQGACHCWLLLVGRWLAVVACRSFNAHRAYLPTYRNVRTARRPFIKPFPVN